MLCTSLSIAQEPTTAPFPPQEAVEPQTKNAEQNQSTEENLVTLRQENEDSPEATLRLLAHQRQSVQRPLRAAREAFDKAASKISEIIEKDEAFRNAISTKNGPVAEEKRNAARREAVARAKEDIEVRKILEEARKQFEAYRKALEQAMKSQRENTQK